MLGKVVGFLLVLSCIFFVPTDCFAQQSNITQWSTRAPVGPGDNALIGGFGTGPVPRFYVIRARGASVNAPNTINDPVLRLFNQATSPPTLVAENDDCFTNPLYSQLEACGLEPPDMLESCIVVDTFGQTFTAVVRPVAGDPGGNGIVEMADAEFCFGASAGPSSSSEGRQIPLNALPTADAVDAEALEAYRLEKQRRRK